jgi:hypothetical protein
MLKSVLNRALRPFRLELTKISTNPLDSPIYLDYPVNPHPRWGYGAPLHPQITAMLNKSRARYIETVDMLARHQSALYGIPLGPDRPDRVSPATPTWKNRFIEGLDAVALSCFLIARKPPRYFEIGSGNSTMFARHSIDQVGLATAITSIDPRPRAPIDAMCDRVIRNALETCDLSLFDDLQAGDVLFYDGSHRSFTNSDVTVFFLEVLPRLTAGVLVHIHDIFLPSDYLPAWNDRLYSEQYVLAAMLLWGKPSFEVILPVNFIQTDPELSELASRAFDPLRRLVHGMPWEGTSFWIETKRG